MRGERSSSPDAAGERYETIRLRVDGGVAWLQLQRPEYGNALEATMARELAQAIRSLQQSPDLRCLVLTGTGEHFCLGGDLRAFSAQGPRLPEYVRKMVPDLHRATIGLAHLSAPVIAAVNGTAAGAGMSLVCAADIAISAASARYTLAYTRVGLSPDGGSTWFLPRIVGIRRAREMALTNRLLTASEALEWGLVGRVVPDDELEREATNAAGKLAAGSLPALNSARRLLHQSAAGATTLEAHLDLEAERIVEAAGGENVREGIAALLDRREPHFADATAG
jgi:2-(1,2-epoxy-1,2-dihydrophenyl)acetyl-CoA isomerase